MAQPACGRRWSPIANPGTGGRLALLAAVWIGLSLSADRSHGGEFNFQTETLLADGEWNSPTSVQVDANGKVHLAYMTQHHTDSATKEIWYATDAHGDWEYVRLTNNSVREEFPYLQLDQAGNVHVAFHTGTATSNQIRYVNNIGAAPGTFNPIIDITGSGFKIVKFAVDQAGVVHFVFTSQTTNFTDEVYYTSWSAPGGVGPLQNISLSPGSEADPDVAIDPAGKVHIAYTDGTFIGPLVYMHNRSGVLTAAPTGVAGNIEDPIVLISPANVVSIVYRVGDFLFAIDDGGTGAFGPPVPVYSGSYRPSFYNRFAIDAQGRRYIAFASNVGTNRGIFFVPETETGFATPIQLSNTPSSNQGASVALNADGKIVVTYQVGGSNPKTGFVFSDIFVASHGAAPPCGPDIAPVGSPNGAVDVDDLLAVINAWGPCPNPNDCPADIAPSGQPDGSVNVDDLLTIINAWGPCP